MNFQGRAIHAKRRSWNMPALHARLERGSRFRRVRRFSRIFSDTEPGIAGTKKEL